MITLSRDSQSENAFHPMLVTLSGIVTLVKPLQPENAESPMLVTPSGIDTLGRDLQSENAEPAIDSTLGPIVRSDSFEQPLNIDR